MFFCSFSWEEVTTHNEDDSKFYLLAVGSQGNLKLLETESERSATISLLCVSECPVDHLLHIIKLQDQSEYHKISAGPKKVLKKTGCLKILVIFLICHFY